MKRARDTRDCLRGEGLDKLLGGGFMRKKFLVIVLAFFFLSSLAFAGERRRLGIVGDKVCDVRITKLKGEKGYLIESCYTCSPLSFALGSLPGDVEIVEDCVDIYDNYAPKPLKGPDAMIWVGSIKRVFKTRWVKGIPLVRKAIHQGGPLKIILVNKGNATKDVYFENAVLEYVGGKAIRASGFVYYGDIKISAAEFFNVPAKKPSSSRKKKK